MASTFISPIYVLYLGKPPRDSILVDYSLVPLIILYWRIA